MNNQKNTRLLIGLLIFVSVFLILVLLLSFVLIFILFSTSSSSSKVEVSDERFQYQEYNPLLNTSSFGIVNIPSTQNFDEFIVYPSPKSKSIVIISQFDDESSEYECTGSCVCNSDNLQRRASSVLTRGLFLIISALTTPLAIRIAEQTFHQQCQMQFSSSCSESSEIVSQVTKCSVLEKIEYEFGKDTVVPFEEVEIEEVEVEHVEYSCSGHCLSNKKINKQLMAMKREKDVHCQSFKTSSVVSVPRVQEKKAVFGSREEKQANFLARNRRGYNRLLFRAKVIFVEKWLSPFCAIESVLEYQYPLESSSKKTRKMGKRGRKRDLKKTREAQLCVGTENRGVHPDAMKNIKCVKVLEKKE